MVSATMFRSALAGICLAAAGADASEARTRDPSYQRGVASYYAHSFHGRTMANGQRFNVNSDSAAHRSLPFGTRVRVTNLSNGLYAYVTIRDRGPFVRNRIIDLSPSTASAIGMRQQGISQVRIEVIRIYEVAQAP